MKDIKNQELIVRVKLTRVNLLNGLFVSMLA